MENAMNYQTLEKGLGNLIVDKDARYLLNNCKLDIIVKENVNLEIVNFRGCDEDDTLSIRLEKNASVKIYNIVITSTDVVLKENIYLEKPNGNCEIISVLLATEDASLNSDINIKPRLRMMSCYYMAALLSRINKKKYLVVGTSNKCELFVGYFTKGGDKVHDLSLLAELTAEEVIFKDLIYV